MLYQLKNKVSKKCGFYIRNRGDCVRLSKLIFVETNIDLSYNTLRRFYGIVRGTSPSKSTLDTLSKYVGYKNYIEFCAAYPQKKNWDIYQKVFNSIVVDPDYALRLIEIEFQNPEEYIELLITIIGGLTVTNNLDSLKNVFNSPLLDTRRFSYSELLYFGNCIGPMLKQMKTDIGQLQKTKFFSSTIYSSFVDISSLNGNYGNYTEEFNKTTSNKEHLLFSSCILELRNYLNKKNVKPVKTSLTIKNIHPILYGRLMSIDVLIHNNPQKVKHTQKYLSRIAHRKNKIDYLYEFLFSCILAKEIDLMKFIVQTTAHYKISKPYYQEYHYSLFELRDAILKVDSGKNINKELVNLKENTLFRNSHRDFVDIFISVLDYHNSKQKKTKLKAYMKLAQPLNYPLFDEEYCINYFDD